jgi:hypothetical protein
MPDAPAQLNDSDDRKLWFEYIKTLNERHLQASQRSGVTTYVLLATLVGLVYRFGPRLPDFLAQPGNLLASATAFVLLWISVGSFFAVVLSIKAYFAGDYESRAVPKSSEGLIVVTYVIVALAGVAIIALEMWIAITNSHHSRRYMLVVHALWIALNIIYPVVRYRKHSRRAKGVSTPLPTFSPFREPPWLNLARLPLAVAWSLLGTAYLGLYLRTLPSYGLQPLKAAGLASIFSSIVAYLILDSLADATREKFFGLERDIVLNRMTAAEITNRYLRDFTGPTMAQWFSDALATLESRERQLQQVQDSARDKLNEITKIDAQYHTERKERARQLIEGLRKAITDCISQFDALVAQSEFFAESYKTEEETQVFKQKISHLKERHGTFKEKASVAYSLMEQLDQIQ